MKLALRLWASAALTGTALSAVVVGPALADVNVSFWNYDAGGTYLPLTVADQGNLILGTAPSATFTYSGAIDWVNNAPNGDPNLVSSFLNLSDVSNLTGYASVAAFGNVSLSQLGDNCATCTSFFQITGTGNFSGGTVEHDDGASLYLGTLSHPPLAVVFDSGAETSEIPTTFAVAPGTHQYVLDYVEGNGSPSDLIFTTTGGVPEPATWAMMLLGFAGLGFAGFRKAKTSVALSA
jgi:PEP-CTERM motif